MYVYMLVITNIYIKAEAGMNRLLCGRTDTHGTVMTRTPTQLLWKFIWTLCLRDISRGLP